VLLARLCETPDVDRRIAAAKLFETHNLAYQKVIDTADLFLQFFWDAKVCIFHSSSRVSFLI
jgi:hypothetical protein